MATDRLSDMDLTALADLDDTFLSMSPPSPLGVGRTLNTPPGPAVGVGTRPTVPPSVVAAPPGPTIGVGTRTAAGPSNVTMGVGTTMALRRLAGRPTTGQKRVPDSTPRGRPTTGGKQPRRVPRQNTPTPTAIQAVEEGVVVEEEEGEEEEEELEVEVVVVVEEVVEEVVVEVHRHHPIHRVLVLQEDEEEVVRIVKRTCNNNWKRF